MDSILVGEFTVGELLLVFGVISVTVYLLHRRRSVSDNDRKLPPALPSLPIVGSLPFLPTRMEDLAEFCISPRNKLGKVFSFRAGSKWILVISGRKAVHEALATESAIFATRPELYFEKLINPRLLGIVTHPYNTAYKMHHQLCLSIFKRFGFGEKVMETRIMMEVDEMVDGIRAEKGHPFDIRQLISSCVANVVVRMLFGRRFDRSNLEFQQLMTDVNEMLTTYPLEVEIFPLLRRLPYYKKTIANIVVKLEKLTDFVNTKITECLEDDTMSESFVHYYVEAQGPNCDREQLLFTTRDLIAAAMETTATTIRWAVVLLTNHDSVQERVRAEIDSVVGRHRQPTFDDRLRMPYVEATILEVMRYKSVIPMLMRITSQDTEFGGYFISCGTTVMLSLHSVRMDPDDWQSPQHFSPERFLDDSGNLVGRDRFMPFGLGKRSCMGEHLARQELFLFLVAMLQNFHLRPPDGQDSIEVHDVWGDTIAPSAFDVCMIARDDT